VEIEAKFAVPDMSTFQRLLAAKTLAGMRLVAGTTQEIHDRYLDTPDQAIRRGGYACRLRQRAGKRLLTFKGLGGAAGAIHQRAEHETTLPAGASLVPTSWPNGPARDLAEKLCQDQPLETLFDLHQTRHIRMLANGDRTIAELSLDEVQVGATVYLELEVELTLNGTMDDLRRIAHDLVTTWHLAPEPRSKFELALATLDIQRGL